MGFAAATRGPSAVNLSELVKWLPKQETAFQALFTHRYILYGGARGPGKSYWLRWGLLCLLLYWFMAKNLRDVRVALFCETYPDLRDRQISKIKVEFPLWLGELKSTEIDGLGFFLRPEYGGGVLLLRNLDDPEKYQSAEFAAIGVDELTKNDETTYHTLRGSMRWPGVNHTVFMGATNPGGVGHLWVKRRWIDRDFPPNEKPLADQFIFIKALPSDNPYLDETYWAELNSLPDNLRRAWVHGDWDVFAGQAFTSWRQDRHTCEPFAIPEHWPITRAIDWGYAKPFCCLWLAKNPDNGRRWVIREAYSLGLTDRAQARLIQEMSLEHVLVSFADPSMWSPKSVREIVTSAADEYAAEGVSLLRADNDRIAGKRKVDRVLGDLPDGEPGLIVFNTCRNLIRTLPALPYDKTRPEDVDTDAEDHAYDALKYGLTQEVSPLVAQRDSSPLAARRRKSPLEGNRRM